MPFILETIVATKNADGSFHVRPYGLHRDGDGWLFLPFRPSPAIENLMRHPYLVVSAPSDIRVIAGFLTGRETWPLVPADVVDGVRLANTAGHMELEATAFEDDPIRPRFRCQVLHEAAHRPFLGFNRAEAAILEAAILATRLDRLPRETVEADIARLGVTVEKCAGPEEFEAWGWITDKIRAFYGV
jgi:hypothetical protein